MTTITVTATRTYEVRIGHGILETLGRETAPLGQGGRACVVTDSNVAPLYLGRALDLLQQAGLQAVSYTVPAGEESKHGETYLALLEYLAAEQLTRADILIALGGGVVGDLSGFAAATYLRGIPYIQVPTTLLAMVDSSVGGKTAIDLQAGKNLAGAFYQPSLVLCDPDALDTLLPEDFADGCAEVIKYGMLGSRDLLQALLERPLSEQLESVIAQCVSMKRDLVEADEFDTGARQLLNLGHTLGHAIEAGSGYAVSHGRAVAAGMAVVTRAAVRKGVCPLKCRTILEELLRRYYLPDRTVLPPEELYEKTLSDKKRSGDRVNLVVPVEVGKCALRPLSLDELRDWVETGLAL